MPPNPSMLSRLRASMQRAPRLANLTDAALASLLRRHRPRLAPDYSLLSDVLDEAAYRLARRPHP
jgi:hypothetical protein